MSSLEIAGFFQGFPCNATTVGFSSFILLWRADPADGEKKNLRIFLLQ
jgi:hypothetical protein